MTIFVINTVFYGVYNYHECCFKTEQGTLLTSFLVHSLLFG
jgi:hypothetical protein